MIEQQIEIETADGRMTTFEYHPEEGGPYPIVLYLMDAPSIRPELKDMASRLATAGYCCHFFTIAKAPTWNSGQATRTCTDAAN